MSEYISITLNESKTAKYDYVIHHLLVMMGTAFLREATHYIHYTH